MATRHRLIQPLCTDHRYTQLASYFMASAIYPVPSPVFPGAHPPPPPPINYDSAIIFHSKSTDAYFGLTPYAQIAFNLEGYWLTLEHYIQAKKFEGHPPTIDAIKKMKEPQEISAFVNDDETSRFLNDTWNKKKCEYMYQGLFAKFSQNRDVFEQLLRTENKFLIYKNGAESMWGIGHDDLGSNYLGRLLCNLRTYLRHNPSSKFPPTYKFSNLPDNKVVFTSTSTSSDDVLHFGDKDKRYFELCNDSNYGFELDGVLWMTVTHYYLAQKFQGKLHLQTTIASFESPGQARQFAYSKNSLQIPDFDSKKDNIMQCALSAKFSKYPSLAETLCSTHPKQLVFECAEDLYWGVGRDTKGLNRLGVMLQDLRTRLLATSHGHRSDAIYFFKPESDYFEFTPYSQHWISLDGKRWQTVSHYFQAQKFRARPDIASLILNCTTAQAAWDIAHDREYVKVIPASYMNERDDIMRKAMRAKVEQNEDVFKLLKGTGRRKLVFAGEDTHWGIGHERTGENMIGKILMHIRDTLASVLRKTPETYKPFPKLVTPPVVPREIHTSTDPIRFFHLKDNLYPLTTFSVYQFRVAEYVYRSLNHYFQAQKFITSPDIHRSIINAPTALEALKISQDNAEKVIPDFNANRLNLMELGLKARFDQNPSLKELLIDSGNKELIFNNERDSYWGIGDGTGKNHFGKLLMKIREQINRKAFAKLTSTSPHTIPTYDIDTEPIDYPPDRKMPMPKIPLAPKHIFLDTECVEPPTSFAADKDNSVILAKNASGETIATFCDPNIRYPSSLCYDEQHLYVITAPTLAKINKITGKKVNQIPLSIAQAQVNCTRNSVRVFDQRSSTETVYNTDLKKH